MDSVEHLKIVSTVTNTGDETLKVLNDPRGPLNKLPTADAKGAQPSFTGIELKYVPNTAAALGAFTILAPGEYDIILR
jgi:peptidyl-Lys metalloendopeptidase